MLLENCQGVVVFGEIVGQINLSSGETFGGVEKTDLGKAEVFIEGEVRVIYFDIGGIIREVKTKESDVVAAKKGGGGGVFGW